MTSTYLAKSELYFQLLPMDELQKVVSQQAKQLEAIYSKTMALPISTFTEDKLYVYETPKFKRNSCSLEHGTEPYDLQKVLGAKIEEHTRRLAFLNAAIDHIYNKTKVGWIGIYKKFALEKGDALVKMAYHGLESRAEFPLYLPDFQSNNKEVGLTGKAIIINDIDAFLNRGGAYYECDAKVQSEVCLPIFNKDYSEIIGIIDAEDHNKYFFDVKRTMEIIALCINLSRLL